MNDLRFAIRSLWKNRLFSAAIILTLAIGIGANTAIFSVVDKVLLKPLPFEDADRLVEIREYRGEQRLGGVSPPIYVDLLGQTNLFENMTAYQAVHLIDFSGDYPEFHWGAEVTPNFFKWLRRDAVLGRTFAEGEGGYDDKNYVVLSDGFWKSRFGADPKIVGASVEFARYLGQPPEPYTVIGVMPPEFGFPGSHSGGPAFWTPDDLTTHDQYEQQAWQKYALKNWTVAARLAPGTSPERAQAALLTIASRHKEIAPRMNKEMKIFQRPLHETFAGENLAQSMWAIMGVVAFVLLIACANIGNLQLNRTEARQKEMAIRAAMGAGRGRLTRQLLTENLVLSLTGGALGILVGWWGMIALTKFLPAELPRLNTIQLDGRLLAFTLALSAVCGVVFGLAPSWRPIRHRFNETLKEGGQSSDIGGGSQWTRQSLIVSQVALTVVLLSGAGLMVQSVSRLLNVDPGFDPENLLTVNMSHMVKAKNGHMSYMNQAQYRVFLHEMRDNFKSVPGVMHVGSMIYGNGNFRTGTDDRPRQVAAHKVGSGELDFFRAKGIQLVRGRNFDSMDEAESASTIIVSEAAVREFWPGTDGLKQQLNSGNGKKTFTVVGVVPDVRDYKLDEEPGPVIYEPAQRAKHPSFTTFLVRTATDPAPAIASIRTRIWEADKSIPPVQVSVVEDGLIQSTKARRVFMWMLTGFAGVGLSLALVGIYGTLAYGVSRRTREIGVRMALGARALDVIRLVMSQGARAVLVGVFAGLAAANWLSQFLSSMLFGVTQTDPLNYSAVAVLMLLAAAIACLIPANRAARIHPMEALRHE